jgi:hypothetical protein
MTGGVHSTPLMVFDRCSYSRKSGCYGVSKFRAMWLCCT